MSEKFVILLHTGHGADHWDLMLQRGGALATWQLDRDPRGLEAGRSVTARKLADHRLAYLNYEGPVSHGRGLVARLDAGTYGLLSQDDAHWEFRLEGREVRGRFELRHAGGDPWAFSRLGD